MVLVKVVVDKDTEVLFLKDKKGAVEVVEDKTKKIKIRS